MIKNISANKFLCFAFQKYYLYNTPNKITRKDRIYCMSLVVLLVDKNSFCLLIIFSEKM